MPSAQKNIYKELYMKKTYTTGLKGEEMASLYLQKEKNMRCLEHRYRSKCGEIDLIMLDNESIVFVEVKTRLHGEPGSGLMAVDYRKQKRIAQAAVMYLMKNNFLNRSVRFDLVEITGNHLLHIQDAFQPGGLFYR